MQKEDIDWSQVDESLAEQVCRSGEKLLDGQLTVATSADQRAAVLGGIYAASATAVAAGLLAAPNLNASLAIAGSVTAALFFVGGLLCILTMMPSAFHLSGGEPVNWYESLASKKMTSKLWGEEAENYQQYIESNNKVLEQNSRWFKWGARIGLAAPLLGAILWAIVSFLPSYAQQLCGALPS